MFMHSIITILISVINKIKRKRGIVKMKVSYIRVSSKQQHTERQEDMMLNYNIGKEFIEKVSGKDMERSALKEMLNFVREGDVVYIESLSRLGRSTTDLIEIVNQLDNKRVSLVSIKESLIDTTTASGRLIFGIFACLAQFEREQSKERQREGIDAAKERGKHLGRPRAEYPPNWRFVHKEWKEGKITAVQAAKDLKIIKSTFYNLVRRFEGVIKITK